MDSFNQIDRIKNKLEPKQVCLLLKLLLILQNQSKWVSLYDINDVNSHQ